MTAIIETEKLTKAYGSHRGIGGVALAVEQGEVFGFLGPNGAGKTTTIRTLLDLIRPTSGVARVFGIDSTADPVAIHRRIGYLPGELALYNRLTGAHTLAHPPDPPPQAERTAGLAPLCLRTSCGEVRDLRAKEGRGFSCCPTLSEVEKS